jgi:uncharacterized protein YjcR
MAARKTQKPFIPRGETPIKLLFDYTDYTTTKEIAEAVGVAPNTIRRWDNEDDWRAWALQKIGFEIVYVGLDEEEEEAEVKE